MTNFKLKKHSIFASSIEMYTKLQIQQIEPNFQIVPWVLTVTMGSVYLGRIQYLCYLKLWKVFLFYTVNVFIHSMPNYKIANL